MNVQLIRAGSSRLIENLYPYYIYDMSEFLGLQPNPEGSYVFTELLEGVRDYWTKENHYPYLIYADKQLAGFCLIRNWPHDQGRFDMGQFFVLRKYKGCGVGRRAFQLAVQLHPGDWLVRILPENDNAQHFWPKAIRMVATGDIVKSAEQYQGMDMDFLRFSAGG